MSTDTPRPKTILVVEDEPVLRLVAVGDIEDAGMIALEASNGSQALEILATQPSIDFLFTDIDMPGSIDGVTLASIVQRHYPCIRVILVSGLCTTPQLMLETPVPFYAKPYDMVHILQHMQLSS
ncbi:response regulator [Ochrobactrum quorumnocens]|jgi:CheY-like chemotaxis protein|uniref:Polar-differentiation response regulator DivK n=1 Tax=Ochrobactrum quorumnocens TaxID=271865 RepID=A0A5N1JT78_9HYPH|nr:response regulator [[Ochrobactrum] quorumnocens]KAA9367116.1 response regulator [[Ochrobactrum] quorumnocens]MBD7992741.1 response regulator [Ochrobactrum gallinarum]